MEIGNNFAFYGTLRKNHGNWNYFLNGRSNHKGQAVISGYKMYSFGGYPFVVKTDNENDTVVVELFDVTDQKSAEGLDRMEIGAGYYRHTINVDGEDYTIYLYKPFEGMESFPEVTSGDWTEYRMNSH